MANKAIRAVVCKPIVKGEQCFQMLEPLACVLDQDTTPYVGPWLPVQAGSSLQLTVTVIKLEGTLLVHLETSRNRGEASQVLGAFPGFSRSGTADLFVVSDAFVRVVATPGTGPRQKATWKVSGKAFVPYAPAI